MRNHSLALHTLEATGDLKQSLTEREDNKYKEV